MKKIRKEQRKFKRKQEEKKQKKLREKRVLVNDLTKEVERWRKRIEELNAKDLNGKTDKDLEKHQESLKWAEDALAIQKKRLIDSNYLDLYWDDLSQ